MLLSALLLALAVPSAAAQRPDHLHLDVANVGCGRVDVSGFELPERARLSLRYIDADSGRVLHRATARSGPDGRLVFSAKVSLAGVRTIQVEVVPPGRTEPSLFGETLVGQHCPLPLTGPSSGVVLLLGGILAALLGAALVIGTTQRGRHVRR